MDISYNWLKDLVEIDLTPQETAENLTKVGMAVEGIHPFNDDYIFDIDLTSNRGDCLSHLGVARELSTITNCALRLTAFNDQSPQTGDQTLVTIEDADICHRFTARIIKMSKSDHRRNGWSTVSRQLASARSTMSLILQIMSCMNSVIRCTPLITIS